MAGAEHQVVCTEVELLDQERHQGQVVAEGPAGQGQVLEDAGLDRAAAQPGPTLSGRQEIDQADKIGLGPDPEQFLKDALGTGEMLLPFMDDRDSQS
jgi:hypothetical protein